MCEAVALEHTHELVTAKALTQANYDVLFAPRGMFGRHEKKFDVFLIRDHVLLKADLKSITSKNPDTIANRIKIGSDQATRVVVDIQSNIEYWQLIDGLRSGVAVTVQIRRFYFDLLKHFMVVKSTEFLERHRIFPTNFLSRPQTNSSSDKIPTYSDRTDTILPFFN